ncbi:hypothetical protein D6C80_08067, partial [Aureobasidium pullulans]
MSAPQRPEQGHSRHPSSDTRRVAMPRRSTRGPLDMDSASVFIADVFQDMQSCTDVSATDTSDTNRITALTSTVANAYPNSIASLISSLSCPTKPPINTYAIEKSSTANNAIGSLASPTTFLVRASTDNPNRDTIPRHFTPTSPRHRSRNFTITQTIVQLLYTRFACLVLCNQSTLAAKEAKPLSDLLARESSTYTRPHREIFLEQIPWPLRLLLLKLQVLGTADAHRRAIMGLYSLSSECRTLAQKARVDKDEEAFKMWKSRLSDLGIRVAGELVEMGELETARRHLATLALEPATTEAEMLEMCIRKTLLLLKIGDTKAAEECLATSTSSSESHTHTDENLLIQQHVLSALTSLSTSNYTSAVTQLQSLNSTYPSNPLILHNLAIANIYSNNVSTASSILESLVSETEIVFPTLLFNLST